MQSFVSCAHVAPGSDQSPKFTSGVGIGRLPICMNTYRTSKSIVPNVLTRRGISKNMAEGGISKNTLGDVLLEFHSHSLSVCKNVY
jgi:hypothetical protein